MLSKKISQVRVCFIFTVVLFLSLSLSFSATYAQGNFMDQPCNPGSSQAIGNYTGWLYDLGRYGWNNNSDGNNTYGSDPRCWSQDLYQNPYYSNQIYPYPDIRPRFRHIITKLYKSNNGDKIILNSGEVLNITLPSNISTGYSWELDTDSLDRSIIREIDRYYINGKSRRQLMGTPGYDVWVFQASGLGTTTIRLEYKQSWVDEASDIFEIWVTVE